MINYPKTPEFHRFKKYDRTLILLVNSLLFFEVDELADKILNLCDGRHRNSIISALSCVYEREKIEEVLEQLELAGVFNDDMSSHEAETPNSYPIRTMDLHVCHDCNLKCVYCYGDQGVYHGPRDYMSVEVADAAVDFLLEKSGSSKVCTIVFFGGEPLMNYSLIRHVVSSSRSKAEAMGKKMRFSITTNGLLLSDEIIEYFNDERFSVLVSIDGGKEIQDRMRPHVCDSISSYDTLLPRVQTVIKSRNGRVTARTTVTPFNLDLIQIFEDLMDIGFDAIVAAPVTTNVNEPYAFSKADYKIYTKNFEKMLDRLLERYKAGDSNVNSILKKILPKDIIKQQRRSYPCGFGLGMISVSPRGDIYPCQRFVGLEQFKSGNVFSGVDESFQKSVLSKYVDVRNPCSKCWARYACGGNCYHVNYMETGDIFAPNMCWCNTTRKLLEITLGTYAELMSKNIAISGDEEDDCPV